MGKARAWSEDAQQKETVEKVLTNEEERFLETLDRGLNILEEEFKQLQKAKQSIVPGEIVFKLYDTYGFPKDLTELIAREKKFDLDEKGFEEAMQKQRERARKAWKGSGSFKVDPIYQTLKAGGLKTEFVGYEKESDTGEILGILKEGKAIE